MSKIVLFDQPDLKGEDKDFVNDVADLSVRNFANAARSIRVVGQHWVAYSHANFKGAFKVFGPGDHGQLGEMNQTINSLRLVKEDLKNPNIVLYEHVKFGGEDRSILEETRDLSRSGFKNLVSSHKVKEGVWILYQRSNLTGERLISFKGDEWPNYCDLGWNDKLSSVKPLLKRDFEV